MEESGKPHTVLCSRFQSQELLFYCTHAVIDFLLSTTPNLWSKLEKNPNNEAVALELSWTVDLAANYTTIYEAFCNSEE